jgi:putative MATE family efflux protein
LAGELYFGNTMNKAITQPALGQRLAAAWALLRQSLAGTEPDYTSGPVGRAVILLAIPMMLEMAMESVFAVVDIFFVAGLGADAVAAVGLTEAVITPLYAIAVGLSTGVTAMVSRRIGAGDTAAASVVAGQAVWMGLLVSAVVGAIGLGFAPQILGWMGASDSVIEMGSSYTQIMLGGAITIVYLFLLNAVFRGAGDATIAMRALWLANGINIVLDPCLIYGFGPFPEMGVTGAATATNIGRGIGVSYQVWMLTRGRGRVTLGWRHLQIRLPILLRMLRISAGGMLQYLIATSSWIFMMRLVAPFGSAAVAGYTIGIRVLELTFLPAWGLGNAGATLVGQNLGAGQPDRAESSAWRAVKYNAVFLISVAVVFLAGADFIVPLFSPDPEVVRYGTACMRIIACGFGFYAVGMVLMQAFNGAGDTFTPSWINAICFWMIQIPLAYTLIQSFGFGPEAAFISIALSESLVAVIGVPLFRRGKWKLREV